MTRFELAQKIAKEAGGMMMKVFVDPEKNGVHAKEATEIVTDLDRQINDFLMERVREVFFEDDLVTEEADIVDSPGSTCLYIDPIDGTDNFVWGIPFFCVSIGCADEEGMLFGVVYDPVHDEMFMAERGKGALVNNASISISSKQPPDLMMRLSGSGYTKESKQIDQSILESMRELCIKDRFLGSAALMLAYIACGRAEVATITGAKPWDLAAGSLLVKEAGGKVTNYNGSAWDVEDSNILASNGFFHKELVKICS